MQGMHWAQRTARALVAAHPRLETYVLAAGISPAGAVHIGNFREVVTTYFVVKALKAMGKKTRFIFSWDDFDRFRRVPEGLDPSYEQYIGMPYSKVPDPKGCCESFAAHYEREFEATLKGLGMEVEFLYQTHQYQSGRYREGIHRALVRREQIYDILMSFKTEAPDPKARQNFYPINLYCERCGKDHTTIDAYDEGARILYYSCLCQWHGAQSVREATNVKLMWKVDWPMRWLEEGVVFEPGGRNHSAQTGSYNVSTVIAREVFGFTAPAYMPYEFIGIQGGSGPMGHATGLDLTPGDLLKVYAPEVLLSLFLNYQPQAAFDIGMDDAVIKHHTDFERLYHQYQAGTLASEDQRFAISLCELPNTPSRLAPYAHIANVLPLVAYDRKLSRELLVSQLEHVSAAHYHETCDRVAHWIAMWQPQRASRVNRAFNRAYYVTLPSNVKDKLKALVAALTQDSDGQAWLDAVYAVTKDHDEHHARTEQGQLFVALYHLLISKDQGPKLPLLVDLMGGARAYQLLAGTVR